jgi:long-chain acyl-CoA synthetase
MNYRATRSTTMADLPGLAVAAFADRIAIAARDEQRGIVEWTYAELGEVVAELGSGLVSLGIRRGDPVGILSETRPEWTMVDLAVKVIGGIVVPLYPTSSPAEWARILIDANVKLLVCENSAQRAKIEALRQELPALAHVVLIESDAATNCLSLDGLREGASACDLWRLRDASGHVGLDDTCAIFHMPSSGHANGCSLSHGNFRAVVDSLAKRGTVGRSGHTPLFLPLADVSVLMLQLVTLEVGATLAYGGGDPAALAGLLSGRTGRQSDS